MLQRPQWITLGIALGVLLLLYFGCPTQAPDMVKTAAQRSLAVEATSPTALMRAARDSISPFAQATLSELDQQLATAKTDTAKMRLLEGLAREWYLANQPGISGTFAQQIAELKDTSAAAWALAGTTYTICVRKTASEKEKEFCTQRAVAAYQAAISLDPAEVSHRLNLALTYVYNAPADNPMQGILQLRELQEQYPQNVAILLALAQLAVQTKQYDRAAARLQQAVDLEPNNPEAVCLLARVQEELQDPAAAALIRRCAELGNQAQ